ncbi:acyl carrier protein [Streptomyces ochraceiscleroticus]|uniref:Acyl carrier protein n=1 Tax=Streptomyces ochraceiscleroticus TaxID=47761 RepID=A0ABW1MSJ4_9ACTN|nr:acyl carrier protein [Streptomyces ochraceiscleroticus]
MSSVSGPDLHECLVAQIAEQTALPPEELLPERTFRELDIDSLALVELIVAIENDTGLDLPPDLPGVDRDTTLAEAARVLETLSVTAAEAPGEAPGEADAGIPHARG